MKVSILVGGPRGSKSSRVVRSKYHVRSCSRLVFVACLLLACTILGRSGYLEAQTQQQQTQTQQPSNPNQTNSPDIPTPDAAQNPAPEANDIPVVKTSVNVTDSISASS